MWEIVTSLHLTHYSLVLKCRSRSEDERRHGIPHSEAVRWSFDGESQCRDKIGTMA